MTTLVGADAYAASDEFLALIFADPGLFEDAYTSMVSSWDAEPPAPPHISASATRRPSPKSRNQDGQTPKLIAKDGARGRTPWRLLNARAPPPTQ